MNNPDNNGYNFELRHFAPVFDMMKAGLLDHLDRTFTPKRLFAVSEHWLLYPKRMQPWNF